MCAGHWPGEGGCRAHRGFCRDLSSAVLKDGCGLVRVAGEAGEVGKEVRRLGEGSVALHLLYVKLPQTEWLLFPSPGLWWR